jgi:hypothetical protein
MSRVADLMLLLLATTLSKVKRYYCVTTSSAAFLTVSWCVAIQRALHWTTLQYDIDMRVCRECCALCTSASSVCLHILLVLPSLLLH